MPVRTVQRVDETVLGQGDRPDIRHGNRDAFALEQRLAFGVRGEIGADRAGRADRIAAILGQHVFRAVFMTVIMLEAQIRLQAGV